MRRLEASFPTKVHSLTSFGGHLLFLGLDCYALSIDGTGERVQL